MQLPMDKQNLCGSSLNMVSISTSKCFWTEPPFPGSSTRPFRLGSDAGLTKRKPTYDLLRQRPIANTASQGHHLVADYLLQELVSYSPVKLNHTIKMDIQWMLVYAAKDGNEERVRSCLSKGADINFQPKKVEGTTLCGALSSAPRPLEVVKLLLSRGADPHIVWPAKRRRMGCWSPPHSPPLRLAMLREESLHLIKVLLKFGADAKESSLALFDTVRLKKAVEFRLLQAHHVDTHVRLEGKSLADLALSWMSQLRHGS